MKRLNIKNFTKAVMDMESERFNIKYCTDMDDKYVIGVDSISDIGNRANRHYKLAILKDSDADNFLVWLWDMDKNKSYPMSIWKADMSSPTKFSHFLNGILRLADNGDFSGHDGCKITFK